MSKKTDYINATNLVITNRTGSGNVSISSGSGEKLLIPEVSIGKTNVGKIQFTGSTEPDYAIDENDFGWIDVNMQPIAKGSGSNDPTFTTLTGMSAIQLYTFPGSGNMKQLWSQIHIPHDYRPESGIYLHAHITSDDPAPSGNFKLNFEYTYASNGGVFPPVQTVSVISSFSAVLQHKIVEIETPILAGVMEIDGIVMIRFYRDPNDAQDTFAGDVHLIFVDCHMQVNKFSSKYRNKLATGSFYY